MLVNSRWRFQRTGALGKVRLQSVLTVFIAQERATDRNVALPDIGVYSFFVAIFAREAVKKSPEDRARERLNNFFDKFRQLGL